MDAKGEVLLTIMASLAQQESQSLSQNVKLGIQYRYQQGKVQINHNRFLGYTKDADGNLVIEREQAEIVRRIYREYLQGLSMDKISAGLEADGILTGAGKTKWHTSTINKILRNEKYIGDALLQKTYTTDFLQKSESRTMAPSRSTTWRATMNRLFRRPSSCWCRRNWSADAWFTPATTANATATPASTAFHRLLSAMNAVSFSGAFTGTTEAANPSSGAAAHGWRLPATPAIAGR